MFIRLTRYLRSKLSITWNCIRLFHDSKLKCAEKHTNFQLCLYAIYPRIYEAVANISEHLGREEVTLQ